jgi:hypothetical protein
MERLLGYVFIGLVAVVVAGPMFVVVAHAAVPLILVVGLVVVLLRLVWHFTSRY